MLATVLELLDGKVANLEARPVKVKKPVVAEPKKARKPNVQNRVLGVIEALPDQFRTAQVADKSGASNSVVHKVLHSLESAGKIQKVHKGLYAKTRRAA
jgi:hypothetical protein